MKLNVKDILKPTLILAVICLVASAALVGTNYLTADQIVKINKENAEASRLLVLNEAETFEEAEGYYIGKSGDEVVGYVFETEASGYGGAVKVMTGIMEDGTVSGVVILEHAETPGLGANAEKDDFRDQYKQDISQGDLEVVKNQAASDGTVEAMTGATITTTAVTNAVNEAAEIFRSLKGGA